MSFYAKKALNIVRNSIVLLFIGYLFGFLALAPIVHADSIQLFARVGLTEDDFYVDLDGIQPGQSIPSHTTTTFSFTYASIMSSSVDMIVLTVSWDNQGSSEVFSYVNGSATDAVGQASPVVDTQNNTITWQISPMPASTQHTVYWQLRAVPGSQALSGTTFTVNGKLVANNIEVEAEPLSGVYRYAPVSVTPTPPPVPTTGPTTTPTVTPTITPSPQPTAEPTPTASPTPTEPPDEPGGGVTDPGDDQPKPPPSILHPLIPFLGNIPIIGPGLQVILEELKQIAGGDGGIFALPIPVALTLIPAFTTLIPLASSIPWWQLPSLMAALWWSRRRDQWGVVFDSSTKQPVDPTVVTLKDENNATRLMITDYYGRYHFLIEPGTYTLTAKKTNYSFPSTTLKQATSDGYYDNLYYGEELRFDKDDAIVVNIPIDNQQADWNQANKNQRRLPIWRIAIASQWLFWIGFIWSLIMTLLAASLVNLLVLGLYLLLIGLKMLGKMRNPWGVLRDHKGRAIAGAKIELINTNNPQSKRPPVVTKQSGRYSFLVPKGSYQLLIQLPDGDGGLRPIIQGPHVVVHSQYGAVAKDLVVEEGAGGDSTAKNHSS